MQRLLRWFGISITALIGCAFLAIVVFDTLIVRPVVSKIEHTLGEAKPSERTPPQIVTDMVRRAYGSRIVYFVARYALSASPSQIEGMRTLRRQFTELGVGMLLPLHLSDAEIESFYVSSVYMGAGIHGLSLASERYLGVPLASVSVTQAARLVAIAHAPSAYLANQERLERRTQYLLSLLPK